MRDQDAGFAPSSDRPPVDFRTLGSVDIPGWAGSGLLTHPKRVALVTYLAVARPRGFRRRDELLALFWPELDTEHARSALSQALHHLRKALGPGVLLTRGADEVALDPGHFVCDVVTFEGDLAAGRTAAALGRYRGDFLRGFHLSGAVEFAHWADSERERLHRMAFEAAWRLAEQEEAAANRVAAGHWVRRAMELAPDDEVAVRRLIALLERVGDRAGALHLYEEFARRLARQLDVEPAPETRQLIHAVRRRAEPASDQAGGDRPAPGLVAAAPAASVRPALRRFPLFARVGTVLLLAGVGIGIVARGRSDLEPRRILVIPFDNRTGDPALDPVGTIAADWIVQGLARTDVVDVVPSFQALRLLQALSGDARSEDAGTRSRTLARALGAGTAVAGTYYLREDSLEFQVQVIDVRRGRLLQAVDGVRGPRSDPMIAVDDLRSRTVGAVDFQFDTRLRPVVRDAHRPPSYEAYLAFAAGMEQRQGMEWRRSLAYFRQAFALDTTFTLALFLAAIEHLNLREFAQADTLIRMFGRSRERLSTLERLFLEWIEATIRGDLPGVLEAARKLVPYGYGGQLALDALDANRPQEAREALEGENTDLLPDMWELATSRRRTEAYHRLGGYRRELSDAIRSRKRHPRRVEPLLWEIRALAALGRAQQARERLEEALAMPPDLAWPSGEILVRAADELRAHGHAGAAREILLRALAWYRALPDSQAMLLRYRRHLAATLLRADSLAAAEVAFRKLAADFPQDPYYIASVAVVLVRRGDRGPASEVAEAVLNRNSPYDFGHHLYERARIAAQLGNANEACELLRRAFANGFRFAFVGGVGGTALSPDGRPHLDPVFDGIRTHHGFQELLRGKQ